MIKFVPADLRRMGFPDEAVINTMERHMKRGVGICGHCHMDKTLICMDGFGLFRSGACGAACFLIKVGRDIEGASHFPQCFRTIKKKIFQVKEIIKNYNPA